MDVKEREELVKSVVEGLNGVVEKAAAAAKTAAEEAVAKAMGTKEKDVEKSVDVVALAEQMKASITSLADGLDKAVKDGEVVREALAKALDEVAALKKGSAVRKGLEGQEGTKDVRKDAGSEGGEGTFGSVVKALFAEGGNNRVALRN